MPNAPPTKPPEIRAMCAVCHGSVKDLAAQRVGSSAYRTMRLRQGQNGSQHARRQQRGDTGGRPRVTLDNYHSFMQPTYFMAVWFTHLRQYGAQGAETHLRNNGMGDWVRCW